jgi:peptidoglycan/LPS O-acetylase OafA/YrhL
LSNRIASLDGLRAASILLVILGHLLGTQGYPKNEFTHFFEPLAPFGVRVFFVISGFLITTLLLREHEATGTNNLPNFYLRRAYRIFPAAIVYISLATILWAVTGHSFRGKYILAAYTYTMNYMSKPPWQLRHLWSLGVEEQFYLVWPIVLILFFRWRKGICWAAMLIAPMSRYLGMTHSVLPAVADLLAPGCLLAFYAANRLPRWMYRLPAALATCGAAIAAGIIMPQRNMLYRGITPLLIAISIHILVVRKDRLLNNRVIAYVGTLSYALYLCQQGFINAGSHRWYAAFPQNVGLVIIAALLMHYLIERPMLLKRARLQQSHLTIAH